jgi:hypothetical protein
MSNIEEFKEFEILGHKVRFRPDNAGQVTADSVVKLLKRELEEVEKKIDSARASARASDKFLLVALKLANDRLFMEEEVRESISNLENKLNAAQIVIDQQLSQ